MAWVVVLGGAVLILHYWTLEHNLYVYMALVVIL